MKGLDAEGRGTQPRVFCTCHVSRAQGRNIHEATHSMPIIGDGDTGYGNAMNVKRTVRGYAGVSGNRGPTGSGSEPRGTKGGALGGGGLGAWCWATWWLACHLQGCVLHCSICLKYVCVRVCNRAGGLCWRPD